MVITEEYRYSIAEVLDILKHTKEEEIEKIPLEIIQKLNANKDENYVSHIDFTKELKESNISEQAINILGYIYREYLCNEEEKQKYDKILLENYLKIENEKQENYNNQEIFKKQPNKTENTLIVKHNIFTRIINKMKIYFNIVRKHKK